VIGTGKRVFYENRVVRIPKKVRILATYYNHLKQKVRVKYNSAFDMGNRFLTSCSHNPNKPPVVSNIMSVF
jgi:hypothetical protein